MTLRLRLIPEGIKGTIRVMVGRPWASQGGVELGRVELTETMECTSTEFRIEVPALAELEGKQALFFCFSSPVKEQSICTLQDFVFE